MRSLVLLLLALPLALSLAACSGKDSGGGGGGGSSLDFGDAPGPGDGNGFEAEADDAARAALLDQMWGTLTGPNCWDASYNGSHVGNVSQFQFYGSYEYRHFGFNINFGGITLYDLGTYQGYPTAVLSTWSGEVEMLVLTSSSEFVHVFWHLDGSPVPTVYRATAGACL